MHDLTLNVIYTRGTVRSLSFLLWSMLDHSECRFRLVANGCTPAEAAFLRRFAEQSPRLSFLMLPSKLVMAHGQALNYLQAATAGRRFGFLDSDIFAVEPLPGRMLDTFVGPRVCFCYPSTVISSNEATALANVEGISCTYLSVYDNAAVTRFIQSTGIGFDKYDWAEVPPEQKERLIRMDARKLRYDTGQLLSLLMLEPGEQPLIVESPQLVHIGGFSRTVFNEQRAEHRAKHPNKTARQLIKLRLKSLMAEVFKKPHVRRSQLAWSEAERAAKEAHNRKKRAVGQYFDTLFESLFAGSPLPEPPDTADAAVDEKVQEAARGITTLFERHGRHHLGNVEPEFYRETVRRR